MKYILLIIAGVLVIPIIFLVGFGADEISPDFLLLLTILTPFILALGLYKIIFVLEEIREGKRRDKKN